MQAGDSLSSIAAKMLHDERRWGEIARLNSLITLGHLLVGQLLCMPTQAARNPPPAPITSLTRPAWVPANFHLFVLADEVNPLPSTFHDVDEIVADLQRIQAKSKDSAASAQIQEIVGRVRADKEVLLKGHIPASAVKGPLAIGMTRGLQGVQIIGFALTAADMTHAARKSHDQHSVKPLAAETIRQAGGWASAWAGMKIGAAGDALVGIETGPGAAVTGAIGGIAGGLAGYYGFDWIADHIDRN